MAISLLVQQVSLEPHPLPFRRVRSIHGRSGKLNWMHTHEQAIDFLENQIFTYHVKNGSLAVLLVVARTTDGQKYLKAKTDAEIPQLLFELPQVD